MKKARKKPAVKKSIIYLPVHHVNGPDTSEAHELVEIELDNGTKFPWINKVKIKNKLKIK